MAGIIKSYWESTKNLLAIYRDGWRVALDMEKGGCADAGYNAMVACNPQFQTKTEAETADPDECVRATVAFRQCMQCKPDVFREYIVAMDKGIEENERLRQEPDAEAEDGPRFRWWTGMRNN